MSPGRQRSEIQPPAPGTLLLLGRSRWPLCRLEQQAADAWDGQAQPLPPGKGSGEGLRAEVSFRKLVRALGERSPGGRSGAQTSQRGLQGLPQESGVEPQGRGQAQPLGLSDLGRRKNQVKTASPLPPDPGLHSERGGI